MENKTQNTRREFIKKLSLGTAGLAFGMSAKSYSNIIGSNDRINHAVVGLHSRGKAHIRSISQTPGLHLRYVCDVDSEILNKRAALARKKTGHAVKKEGDIRRLIEKDDIDAISIATPDHWHAPMTLMALDNGKHVYVEKPCCHNPAEGEMLLAAQKKYPNLAIQMGTQYRSAPLSFQAAHDIQNGIIGDMYMGKAWYNRNRDSIGKAKVGTVPKQLNWDLWQGPAPHTAYKPIWVPYNWHWFWHWGTGEINNNGIHEIDICRWLLGVDEEYPTKATSSGGRYAYNDSWQFYDTQVASFEYSDDKMITWEGRSCSAFDYYGTGRGLTIYGTKGTIILKDGSRTYRVFDAEGNQIKSKEYHAGQGDSTNIQGGGPLTTLHFRNFANVIREGAQLHSPIDISYKSNLLAHLGNYAQKTDDTLHIDPKNGHIKNNKEAMKLWRRDYEPGWQPSV